MHRGRPAPGLISCQLLETQPVSKSHKPFNTSSREVVPDVFPVPPPPGPCAPSPPCSALGGRAVRLHLRASSPSASWMPSTNGRLWLEPGGKRGWGH